MSEVMLNTEAQIEARKQELIDFEAGKMRKLCEERHFKHNDMVFPQTNYTPSEHILIGSTSPGAAYHPNFPLSIIDGLSLEQANEMRNRINTQAPIRVPVIFQDNRILLLDCKLLPLTQDQVDSEDFKPTFEIIRASDFKTKDSINLTPDIVNVTYNRLQAGQSEARVILLDEIDK